MKKKRKQAQFAEYVEELKQKGVKGAEYRQRIMQWHREHQDEPEIEKTRNEKEHKIMWSRKVKIKELLISFCKVAQQSYLETMPKTFSKGEANRFLMATILD